MQCVDRRLDNEDRLIRHQPSRMILEQSPLDAVLRTSIRNPAAQDPGESARKAQRQEERPQDEPRGKSCRSEECRCKGRREDAARRERVPRMDLCVCALVQQCDAEKAPSPQFPEGVRGILLFDKVRRKNGGAGRAVIAAYGRAEPRRLDDVADLITHHHTRFIHPWTHAGELTGEVSKM